MSGSCLLAVFPCDVSPLFAREFFLATTGNNRLSCGDVIAPCRTVTYVLDPANKLVNGSNISTLLRPLGQSVFNEAETRLRNRLTIRSFGRDDAMHQNLIVRIPVKFVQHAVQHRRKNDPRENQKG